MGTRSGIGYDHAMARAIDPHLARTLVASERWKAKVEVAPNGCWLWTGALTANGYPKITLSGRHSHRYAHRVALVAALGRDLSDDTEAGHLCHDHAFRRGECPGSGVCDHRRCVNPDHLEEQSRTANRTGTGVGRHARVLLTHCKRGHAYDDANTRVNKNGSRQCRACHAEAERRYRQRKEVVPT